MSRWRFEPSTSRINKLGAIGVLLLTSQHLVAEPEGSVALTSTPVIGLDTELVRANFYHNKLYP
jgi:hypothetical protein